MLRAATPPTVTAINPTSGDSAGNVTVTITGTNFQAGSTVLIGGVPATSVTIISSTQITARTPALGPGMLQDVTVSTSSGSATLTWGFMADFLDVPQSYVFHSSVEKIRRNNITAGCGGGNYCPNQSVTRDQMAVFILRGEHGGGYTPPPAGGTLFIDVPAGAFAADWIELFANEGITNGCSLGYYCPTSPVLRSQMATFLLKGKYTSGYNPPAATGTMFLDVPSNAFGAAFIEQVKREGITSGCDATHYCPNAVVTRGQMAVFISRTFNLP